MPDATSAGLLKRLEYKAMECLRKAFEDRINCRAFHDCVESWASLLIVMLAKVEAAARF